MKLFDEGLQAGACQATIVFCSIGLVFAGLADLSPVMYSAIATPLSILISASVLRIGKMLNEAWFGQIDLIEGVWQNGYEEGKQANKNPDRSQAQKEAQ